MTGVPLVSVIVTTYNHAPYVEQALDSIAAQNYEDFELVIHDDFSQDESVSVIRSWLVRTGYPAELDAHERNLGVCAARNRALARCRGRLICSLSGDDWLEPGRLSRQAGFLLEQDEAVAAVYSDARIVDAEGALLGDSYLGYHISPKGPPEGWIFHELQRECFLPAMAVMVRRSAIDAVGGYDESLMFEDWDMWLRLADRYRYGYLDMVAANRRELRTSLSHARVGTAGFQRSVLRLHEKWLDRDAAARLTAAHWMRRAALTIATEDRREARAALRRVSDVPSIDRTPWRAVEVAFAVPGAGTLVEPVRRAASRIDPLVQAERGAWEAGRRLPIPGR